MTPWIGAVGNFGTDLNYNQRLPPTWKKTLQSDVETSFSVQSSISYSCPAGLFISVFLAPLLYFSFLFRQLMKMAVILSPPSITQAKLMSPKVYQSPRQTYYKGSALLQITSRGGKYNIETNLFFENALDCNSQRRSHLVLIQWRMSTGQTLPCVEKRFSTPEGKNSLFAVNKIICSAFVFALYLYLRCICV